MHYVVVGYAGPHIATLEASVATSGYVQYIASQEIVNAALQSDLKRVLSEMQANDGITTYDVHPSARGEHRAVSESVGHLRPS